MARYVSTALHAVTPSADGTVAPGDVVDLDPAAAAPYVERGELVEQPEPAAPAPKTAETPAKTAKENDQ